MSSAHHFMRSFWYAIEASSVFVAAVHGSDANGTPRPSGKTVAIVS